jgi:hypothetical protein
VEELPSLPKLRLGLGQGGAGTFPNATSELVRLDLAGDCRTQLDRGKVARTGTNPIMEINGGSVRLYLSTYENPRPEVEVTHVDYVSKMAQPVPFLVAMTVEP